MSVERFFKESAQRARFEADKIQRTLKMQQEISNLRVQIEKAIKKLGASTLELYRQEALAEEALQAIGRAIEDLEAQRAERERKLAQIKEETFQEAAPVDDVSGSSTLGTVVCAHCGQTLPAQMRFCIHCGKPLSESP